MKNFNKSLKSLIYLRDKEWGHQKFNKSYAIWKRITIDIEEI